MSARVWRRAAWFAAAAAFLAASEFYLEAAAGYRGAVVGGFDPAEFRLVVTAYTVSAVLAAACGILAGFIGVFRLRRPARVPAAVPVRRR